MELMAEHWLVCLDVGEKEGLHRLNFLTVFAVAGESEAEGFSESCDRRRLRSGAQADVTIVAWGKGIKLGGFKIFMTSAIWLGTDSKRTRSRAPGPCHARPGKADQLGMDW